MTVDEGTFVLYSRIEPPLEAGDYRLTASHALSANGQASSALPVADLDTHFSVRAPRYQFPPDQVLSTFPPAGSTGDYGARLPQVVIRRRTLPWERLVQAGVARETPWLALVLIAEGEAEIKLNQPVASCVTFPLTLPGTADVELGNYLAIRKSMVDRIFPTQLDVPLLAHAREVDIHDTELMMGDDDGFLAVVICNRLPLPGRDAQGEPVPVKYLACLINLEGQFLSLLPKAPPPAQWTVLPAKVTGLQVNEAQWDHVRMNRSAGAPGGIGVPVEAGGMPVIAGGAGTGGAAMTTSASIDAVPSGGATPYQSAATWSSAGSAHSSADVYTQMALDFDTAVTSGFVVGDYVVIDPELRFPVLLHWSFTSFGDTTFRQLMEGLDSGLLGTVPAEGSGSGPGGSAGSGGAGGSGAGSGGGGAATTGRPPLEIVETGHVGLPHRTRVGDPVRCWYRGPLVPHPMTDDPAGRPPLAHAADQLRIVVPDGREDVSLAAAFDIGRLLALARPSMIAALMRWRQGGYQTRRLGVVWDEFVDILGGMGIDTVDWRLGVVLGRTVAKGLSDNPVTVLGNPAPLVSAGRPLVLDAPADHVLAAGFGLDTGIFDGDPTTVLSRLRDAPVLLPADPIDTGGVLAPSVAAGLAATLEQAVDRLVAGAALLPKQIDVTGPGEDR